MQLYAVSQSKQKVNMNSEKVVVEIWSDVVCPFCYIGKKKMEKAVAKLGAQEKVEIIWHSFQLDPSFPKGTSTPSMQYLSQSKGLPLEQVNMMGAQLTQQAKAYDIDFRFDKAKSFNTWDAHRLIQWAKTLHKSNELKEAFMEAYFTNGIDLSNRENILAIVVKVGLNKEQASQILNSDAYTEEVQHDIYQSRQLGIRGVPYFLINETSAISGAQNDQVFENAISMALKELKTSSTQGPEGVCEPNGKCK